MQQWSKIIPVAIAFSFGNAWATDGYFAHGYGVRSQGVGGAGIALPQDALAAAANPAGMGKVGDRVDVGLTWFRPVRESELEGSPSPGLMTLTKATIRSISLSLSLAITNNIPRM